MTLDEAIQHALEQAADLRNSSPCAKDHMQLAIWLTELKAYKLEDRIKKQQELENAREHV